MDNTMYVGLSKQMILRRELDIVANNIANANTAGFKLESMITNTDPQYPARVDTGPRPVKFALDGGVARDFSQGPLQQTGVPTDVAIEGQGFFKISTANGERYTRDGRFTTDATGRLITQAGDPVLGDGGSEITFDSKGSPPHIGSDGIISQQVPGQPAAQQVGKLAVVRFDDLSVLAKDGSNLLRNISNADPQAAPDAVVRQGMIEESNVQPVVEITTLIRINRAYEQINQMMNNTADLSSRAIQRLGQVQ